MRLLPLSLILFVFILGLSGCVSMQRQAPGIQELESSAMLRFNDVPYPAGFRILADKSFILESGGMRAGVLRYTGKADAESVVRFYKTRMSSYNWVLLNVLEYGDRMLNFERQNESCVITIKPKGGRVEVSVSLAPKSPISVPEKRAESERLPKIQKVK